jgi:hypothetical protein
MITLIIICIILYLSFIYYIFRKSTNLDLSDFKILIMIQLIILIVIWVILSKYFKNNLQNIVDLYIIKLNVVDLVIILVSIITSISLKRHYKKL